MEDALPRTPSPIRTYLALKRDPLVFLERLARSRGSFAHFEVLSMPFVLVNDPERIREALVEHADELIIRGGTSAALARLIGHGILTNRGEAWRSSRTSLQPRFGRETLERAAPIAVRCAGDSLDRWEEAYGSETFLLQRELLALSFRIECAALFGYAAEFGEAEAFADTVWTLQSNGMARYLAGLDHLPWLPLAIHRRVERAKTDLRDTGRRIHRAAPGIPVDEILSLLFAGTESPANTLVWALALLADHPDWRARVVADGRIEPGTPLAEIEAFDATAQVLAETMRLYPAGWAFERFAVRDVRLGPHRVPRGTRLLFSPYLLHRDRSIWRDPETFDPGRFSTTPHRADGVPKFAYLPFGAGPRSCIGARLALLEMKVALRTIAARFTWHVEPGAATELPAGAFKLRLRRPVEASVRPLAS